MSIATEIARIQEDRDQIRAKLISLGLADTTSNLDELAEAVDSIVNQGAVQATVLEGSTYTIPAGYHNGSGTVTGLTDTAGDKERYKLQQKTVEPTKKQQPISADSGYYGLSSVTVEAIPAEYQDVTSVTAEAADVLAGKTIVNANGDVVAGEMVNNGTVSKLLTTLVKSFTIPEGYHNGKGAVSITTETKTVTPTKASQTVSPSTDKVLESVVVNPIPAEYIVTNIDADVAAAADNILDGKQAYVDGKLVDGSMPNRGAVSKVLDTTTASYGIEKGYHNGLGSVSIVLETKTATPTKAAQTVLPAEGKVLKSVTVNAIPAEYITTTDADAAAGEILLNKTAYVNGVKVKGTMPNNSAISGVINGMTTMSYSIPAGYTSGGTVTLNGEIEAALRAI